MSNFDELFEELTEPQSSNEKEELPKQEEIIFTVAEFSNILKGTLEQTFKRIKIKGEIIGLKKHSSGTYYFDLKENFAGKDYILNCVLWKWTRINTKIEDGLEVIITGKITAYTGRSSYQITVEDVEVAGIGALLKIIEERKQKLAAEGLFDLSHKKPIPKFPKIIGVITSPTGAVIRDIIHRITDRFPTRIIVYPVAVQGEGADKEITEAINNFNRLTHDKPDVLIVARGGGSMQDLMPFNEENVVRATYNSKIPIISAVGHETDTTLIDYASDLRAPTPTGAAEKAVPVRQEIMLNISEYSSRFLSTIVRLFENFNLKISNFSNRIKNPTQFIEDSIQRLDDKATKLDLIMRNKLSSLNDKMNFANTMLESYSFKNVLKRGYAIVWNNDEIISSKDDLQKLSTAQIEFTNGKVDVFTSAKKEKEASPKPTSNLKTNKTDSSQGSLF
ncbi:exodeoxyribonuclease VII large subunit [bacterium]|nr:exodeoxyribonuclease VII large subunit [bacterium]